MLGQCSGWILMIRLIFCVGFLLSPGASVFLDWLQLTSNYSNVCLIA